MARNPLSQLASLGEEVLGKASHNPTAARMLQGAMQLRDRVDDLSKRVRGLEQMEKRLAQLEKRIAKLEGGTRKPAAARKPTAAKKTGSGTGGASAE
jgi:TolA-binding protein